MQSVVENRKDGKVSYTRAVPDQKSWYKDA